jgi:hypothetical protein
MTTHWQQGADWQIPAPAPEKGGKEKKQAPSNQAQWKPNSKAGQLVGYRADSGTWGQCTSLNCHTSLSEELTKQLPLKDRREKWKHYPRLWQSFCLNTNTRIGVTPEFKIRLKFYCSCTSNFCLFVCSVSCLFVSVHLTTLISLGVFFVSFTIVN